MEIGLESFKNVRVFKSRLTLRVLALLAMIGVAAVSYVVLDKDPSESASIETVDRQADDELIASEEVGGDNLAASEALTIDGTLDTTGPEDPDDGSDPAAAPTTTNSEANGSTATDSGSPASSSTAADSSAGTSGSTSDSDSDSASTNPPGAAAGAGTGTTTSNGSSPDTSTQGTGTQGTGTQGTGSQGSGGGTSSSSTAPGSTTPPPATGSGSGSAALIPIVTNGIGDGPTGGRQPYTPPAANVGFADIADGNATTVQANCSGSTDCGAELKRIINANSARPLKITFGDPNRRGATINFRSPVVLKSGVYLEGINQPTLVVTSGSILFNVSGTKNVSIRNFDLEMQGCRGGSNAVVAAASPVQDLFISGINVVNAAPNATGYCENDFLRITAAASGRNIHVYGNDVHRLRRFVYIKGDLTGIKVLNNTVTEIGLEGYLQTGEGTSRDVLIEGNVFSGHAPKADTGHMIGFPLSKAASPQTYARNVVIRNNLVEGNPNIPHIRLDNGDTVPNGGAGDLIAVRGIDGFLVEGNMVRHSGEVGITATAGLKNGVIRYNQVSYTDTTGIVLGNEARNSNERVSNIDVYGNEMFQNSLDRNREYTDRDHPTFSLWNTVNACIVDNYIHDNTNSNGFWVWNGNNSTWPASVFDVYIADNRFENNIRDFVESSNARGPYSVASPSGGENWTSTYDGAVDSDNDGLPRQCASETNDSDPCVPHRLAQACRR